MWQIIRKTLNRYPGVRAVSSLRLTVTCLLLLFILTFWGTVHQVQYGLYDAQEKFFHSFCFLAFGFLPFPGARLVLWVLFVNLLLGAVTKLPFHQRRHVGLIIIHFGLMSFFVAAFVTFHVTTEAQLTLAEGEASNAATDGVHWELALWQQNAEVRDVYARDIRPKDLGKPLSFGAAGITLTPVSYLPNAQALGINPQTSHRDLPLNISGIGELRPVPLEKEPGDNIPGGILRVSGSSLDGKNLLLYGAESLATPLQIDGKPYFLKLRRKHYTLPFILQLKEFYMEQHPGTETARSYKSDVSLESHQVQRDVTISMNKPLRYKEFTFYQASYHIDEQGREYSTLAVVKNTGRLMPYIATFITVAGMLIHFLTMAFQAALKRRSQFAMAVLALAAMLVVPLYTACAQDTLSTIPSQVSLEIWKSLPILDQGRIKPLETYARNLLLQFSGRAHYQKESAIAWLARLLFAGESTYGDAVFLINHPEIPMALGITPKSHRRYSFQDLQAGLEKLNDLAISTREIEEKERSVVEQEIVRVHANLVLYTSLSSSFSFAFPHPDFTVESSALRQRLGLPADQKIFSFLDIALRAGEMKHLIRSENPEQWDPQEKAFMNLVGNLYHWSQFHTDMPLTIMPPIDPHSEMWLSPWDMMSFAIHQEETRKELGLLVEMIQMYHTGNTLTFDLATKNFRQSVLRRIGHQQMIAAGKIPLELHYNNLNGFFWATCFYALGIFCCLCTWFWVPGIFYRVSWIVTSLGLILHLYTLILRMAIMSRPPVTNLFETFIFVGLVSGIAGLCIEALQKNGLGLLVGNIGGFLLLLISAKFAAEGDSLRMLVAVLDSNFWLSTHVLAITTGYAGCCVAGIIGHIYILQALLKPQDTQRLQNIYHTILGTLGFGLMMSFLGTALGGIWADQSWGRFWGWDPKENGALLIVLWCAIIFHAKIGRLIGPLGVAVGAVVGLVVVMWAWFGVNLLSVGLHSYGFTSGIATCLGIYMVVEVIFLGSSLTFLHHQRRHAFAVK
jgi:ABC-type transport system involved in cytochrome c biogenesis permease subunit